MNQNTCSIEDCNREIYNQTFASANGKECILHCRKPIDSRHYQMFLDERDAFYDGLLDYICSYIDKGHFVNKTISSNSQIDHKFLLKTSYAQTKNTKEELSILKNEINRDVIALDSIHFINIHFPRPDRQGSHNYEKLLQIINQIDFNYCYFYGCDLTLKQDNQVFFGDCQFYNSWSIKNSNILENVDDVIYSSCIFHQDVDNDDKLINNSQFNYLCTFEGKINITNAKLEKQLFNNNQGYENHQYDFLRKITFTKCEFGEFELLLPHKSPKEKLDPPEIFFESCYFTNKFKIRNVEKYADGRENMHYKYHQEHKARVKILVIRNCKSDQDNYLRIGYIQAQEFTLANLRNPQNTDLNIGDCHFIKFKLFKINTLKTSNIDETKENTNFQIDNTSIGDADFQSINLSSFNSVKMFDNIFDNIKYTNINWGNFGSTKEITVDQYNNDDNFKLKKQQDTYRTLKNVALKNNDKPQAIKFFAKEMENAYYLENWDNFSNKFTLFFNKITNN